jgi:hypothetical protein
MIDFDEIACEEFYNEDFLRFREELLTPEYEAWLDELEREYVNLELGEIAEEQKAGQVEVDLDALVLG